MTDSRKIISIDISSKSVKIGLVSENLDLLAASQKEINFVVEDLDGFARSFNMDELWELVVNGIKSTLKTAHIAPEEIIGISSCAQRMAAVFLDKKGKEIYGGPNIDVRGIDSAYLIEDHFTDEELYQITGHIPPMLFCLARLLWFQEEEEDKYEKVDKVLMLDDWIIYKLTGNFYTDRTSASDSQLFDVKRETWSEEIIEAFNFDFNWFPEVVDPRTIVGDLTPKMLQLTGIGEHTIPVIKSGGDTQASLLGMGAVHAGDIGLTLGTTGPLHLILDKPLLDPEGDHWLINHSIKNTWMLEANAGNTGTVYDWYKDCFLKGLTDDPDELVETHLKSVDPQDDSTLAFLGPELTKIKDQTSIKRGVFVFRAPVIVAEEFTKLPNFTKAVIDNIGFGILENYNFLKQFTNSKSTTFCAGGLANSEETCKILANILDTEIKVPKKTKDSAFIGLAMNTLIGLDYNKSETELIEKFVEHDFYSPDQAIADKYKTLYSEWRQINDKIEDL